MHLTDPLASRDTILAAKALQKLGVSFTSPTPGELVVHAPEQLTLAGKIDCGLAGTVMRFVPALAAFGQGSVVFDGDQEARHRPLEDLLTALEQLGAKVEYLGEAGKLPFRLTGRTPTDYMPVTVVLDSSATSQYLSALLLAAPAAPTSFGIELSGQPPSAAHIEMTEQMLIDQGVPVSRTGSSTYMASNHKPAGNPVRIEADLSNAGPFLAGALICGGQVRLENWPARSTQAGVEWADILPRFGGKVSQHGTDLVVTGPESHWEGIDIDLSRVGELTPTVAALCALASSPSRLRGIAHLRGHETDRLAALVAELNRCGAAAKETDDGLIIQPSNLHPADFRAYADHRMATFGALMGLALPGSTVDDIACTSKTLPDFPERWEAMLEGVSPPQAPSLASAVRAGEQSE